MIAFIDQEASEKAEEIDSKVKLASHTQHNKRRRRAAQIMIIRLYSCGYRHRTSVIVSSLPFALVISQ